MTAIDLSRIPYTHRFNGASLLISKANRLADSTAALAYFDMALLLMKPYDPNYATVANWKCNVLIKLEQYEEAIAWYREIVSISDKTDGRSGRNATAKLAEEMIAKYSGLKNSVLPADGDLAASFDDPPFCMHGEEFCTLLAERKFKKAYAYLAPTLQHKLSVGNLKESWLSLIGTADAGSLSITLEQHMLDWPSRKDDEIGTCYFSVSSENQSEGISLVVARTPHNGYWLTGIEFGRP